MAQKLTAAGCATAALDARLLVQHAGGLDQTELAMAAKQDVPPPILQAAEALLRRRLAGRPVSKILRRREFWGREFAVSEAVLDPRPDSETLVAAMLEKMPLDRPVRVLDLGTGSGCLALTLLAERPLATGLAVDKSRAALAMARLNAHRLGFRSRIALRHSDWFENIDARFDVIVSNPPYIETAALADLSIDVRAHDPRAALDGGPDGLAPYRLICAQAAHYLTAQGWLAFEVGAGQAGAVQAMLAEAGFQAPQARRDLAGHARVVMAETPGKKT
jgi:release factor glutamine methyltransferase